MHVVSMKRLREFWTQHPDAEVSLRRWYRLATKRRWENLAQVREDFPHADPVRVASGTTMTVFNVGGNRYRIVARMVYDHRVVYVKMVLTHAQYSKDRWKEQL